MEILVSILVGLAWFILIGNFLHSMFYVTVVEKAKDKNKNKKENVK